MSSDTALPVTALADDTPIIVGIGQHVERDAAHSVLSPVALAAVACGKALGDSGHGAALAGIIDTVVAIRFFEHSTKGGEMLAHPFGCSDNVPRAIARRVGIAPRRAIYADVGGQTPQRLVNRFCAEIQRGETQAVLIGGAEAIATIKHAVRTGREFDWREDTGGECSDEWQQDKLSTPYERAHGLFLPLRTYPLLEHARRRRRGLDCAQYRREMGELFAPFSAIAAANPYAQFPQSLPAAALATIDADNYLISEPYTKALVAQDAVNQGAAVVLTSVGIARRLGIVPAQWVFLASHADLDDRTVSARIMLERSLAQELVLERVLEAADTRSDDIAHLDLYSCFPIAVFSACDALGIDWRCGRALTLTGGLPFFGGPGNNYSTHAICEAVARVRADRGTSALVVANGGYLSKHSAGLYAGALRAPWRATDCTGIAQRFAAIPAMPLADPAPATGVVESYVMAMKKGRPDGVYLAATTDTGSARFFARVAHDDTASIAAIAAGNVFGKAVAVTAGEACNLARVLG
ncbi:MAG: acetyl-CoA acetyltransferase [Gammaproteobacteria bacterium]|nr:acetyl-CoA acetyltransferase [Gammaproteobacteria bacterium]